MGKGPKSGLDRYHQPLKYETLGPNITNLGVELVFPAILPRDESENSRIVNEITKIVWDGSAWSEVLPITASATRTNLTGKVSYRELSATERAIGNLTIGNASIIDVFNLGHIEDTTTGISAGYDQQTIQEHDLTDEDGYGLLTSGKSVFVSWQSDVNLSALLLGCAIYYRQHRVGLTEWVGIFASRQQNPSS